jgi:uncharacterized protein YndB with AHSA1/START domain
MSVTNVRKDTENLTMTITAEFDEPVDRVWQLWDNPRLLERWWGPPTYPATVEKHDLTPGGEVTYFMTGPEGDTPHGWWRVVAVEAPHRLEFEDGFADDTGKPNLDLPVTTNRVTLEEQPRGRTRMQLETAFPSVAAMQQMIEMGMEEGIQQAMSQMDGLLRAEANR